MTELQSAVFRALALALAVDGLQIVSIEKKAPPPRVAARESGRGLERLEA